ncbi:hypothetical protein [Pseudothermotoga thermarum]|uniref:Uncharacterized protein n=1 Tax=Pseudothermotoga thermarum DSM 5069 TaxID=688269 RepID=F7YX33_9THEM|nr:hypothetical protein [Pseudothermotoga thermarum]AEH50748.1 hypothetical protein Theth_0661 [Pseudothermotoga thermarum DSM 5069]
MIKRAAVLFLFSVCVLFVVFFVLRVCSTPSKTDTVVERWFVLENTIDITADQISPTFYKVLKKPDYVVVQAQIPEVNVAQNQDKVYLFLPQITASYVEVYANENLIGSFGCVQRKK